MPQYSPFRRPLDCARYYSRGFPESLWQMANEMLKKNGFRPEWLEDDITNRHELDEARRALARSRDWHAAELESLGDRRDAASIERRVMVQNEWRLAQDRFRARLAAINKSIFSYNLKVPSTRLQRLSLDVEAELKKLL